jgi:hypothetical protein
LDRLLDQAGLTIYPYAKQCAIGVVAALGQKPPARFGRASYSGPFRFEASSVVARRDLLQPDRDSLVVGVEAMWEPRLRIIGLMHQMRDVTAVDERGQPLPAAAGDAKMEMPDVPVSGEAPAVRLDLPLRLPPRTVQRIARLKGRLLATIAGKIESFRFDKLAGARNVEQRIAGVTVTLEEVRRAAPGGRASDTAWEVRLRVRFDDAGDALASHRQWIFGNEAFLEDANRKPIAFDSFETTHQDKNEVGVAYLFRIDRPMDELSFVYKTPGTIIAGGFDYELHDIRLP